MVMAIFISLSFTQHSLKHCITEVAFKNGQPLLNWQSIAFHIDKILVQNQSWRAADSIRPFIFNTVFALFSYSSSLGLWDWNFTAVLVEGNRIVDLAKIFHAETLCFIHDNSIDLCIAGWPSSKLVSVYQNLSTNHPNFSVVTLMTTG